MHAARHIIQYCVPNVYISDGAPSNVIPEMWLAVRDMAMGKTAMFLFPNRYSLLVRCLVPKQPK